MDIIGNVSTKMKTFVTKKGLYGHPPFCEWSFFYITNTFLFEYNGKNVKKYNFYHVLWLTGVIINYRDIYCT